MYAEKILRRLEGVDPALIKSTDDSTSLLKTESLPLPSRLDRLFGTPESEIAPSIQQWMGDYSIRLSLERNHDLNSTLRELHSRNMEVEGLREDLGFVFVYGPVAEAEKLEKLWKDCYFRPGHRIWCSS